MEIPTLSQLIVCFGAVVLATPIQMLLANSKAMKTLTQIYDSAFKRIQSELDEVKKELKELKPLRCDKLDCPKRIPPRVTKN